MYVFTTEGTTSTINMLTTEYGNNMVTTQTTIMEVLATQCTTIHIYRYIYV